MLNRRNFLWRLSGLGWPLLGLSVAGTEPDARQAHRRIGRAYFEQFPQQAALDAHSACLRDCSSLAELVQRDYAEGRVLIVSGWVLSKTECRLCAQEYRAPLAAPC